ncbi:MAG: hypothetical protein QXO51_05120 [Halobacteria archaeon]
MATPLFTPSTPAPSAQLSWVYGCEKCRSKVKLRWASGSVQVSWILLDRALYQGKETVMVYPSVFQEKPGELRCPVCGAAALKKIQGGVGAGEAPRPAAARPSWMQSIPPQMR